MKRIASVVVLLLLLFSTLVLVRNIPFAKKGSSMRTHVTHRPYAIEDGWNFSRSREWGEIGVMDHDSAQLVLGVKKRSAHNTQRLDELMWMYNAEPIDSISLGDKQAILVDLQFSEIYDFAYEVEARNLARFVEPNLLVKTSFAPNDPYFLNHLQWGLEVIEADWAWNTTVGDSSILVAILDTGIDYTHPDLAPNYVHLGYDWVNNDTEPIDDNGHGTHCAGIIAAVLDNGIGIAGVAQVRIMAEKAFNATGWGTTFNIAKAMVHAVDQGARIISCSFGGSERDVIEHEAVQYAYDKGALVLAAAGNTGGYDRLFPAAYNEVVAVSATTVSPWMYEYEYWFERFAYWSSWGEWIEVAAPGDSIHSTLPSYPLDGVPLDYGVGSGTSMACPHAAGVAALIWSKFPNYTNYHVRTQLRLTADDDWENPGFDVYYGHGRINAKRAVAEQVVQDHDLSVSVEIQKYLEPFKKATISTLVTNLGLFGEANISLRVYVNGNLFNTTTIDFVAKGKSATISLVWTPTSEGKHNITCHVLPALGETITGNNKALYIVEVNTPSTIIVPDEYVTIQQA
ncbi:S8 family serine peptidase, partial [Candidatus Bathyarchaeota archaeon]|nr:S8 family serine peptidase [Candidatus Bathyarchaeota archaeon]